MLHFVEGLPHNNLKNYSFQFEEDTYQITSIVQYQTDKKHFITWSLNPDGKNHKFCYNTSWVYIKYCFMGYCSSLSSQYIITRIYFVCILNFILKFYE